MIELGYFRRAPIPYSVRALTSFFLSLIREYYVSGFNEAETRNFVPTLFDDRHVSREAHSRGDFES